MRIPDPHHLAILMPLNSSEEYFDVVDEQDQVVSRLPRSEVHRLEYRHRAVHVFLFRSDGMMLVHKRSDTKEEFPSVWTSSCSGHVSSGEDYDETAERELQEELGVVSSVIRLQRFAACPDTSHEFTMLYEAHSDSDILPDPGEISATRWMPIDKISEWMSDSPEEFSPAFRLLFRWYCVERPQLRTPGTR